MLLLDRDQVVRTIGGAGLAPGRFRYPCSACVAHGYIYAAEETRLQVLTRRGVPLQVLSPGFGRIASRLEGIVLAAPSSPPGPPGMGPVGLGPLCGTRARGRPEPLRERL